MILFVSILLFVWAAVLAFWEAHAAFENVPPWTHALRTTLIAAFITIGVFLLTRGTP